MELGATFPQHEIDDDVEEVATFARDAENLEYEQLLAFDHVLGGASHQGGFDVDNPVHEPLTLFGFLAGITSSIDLVTGILILPQRQTALVAKQAAEVDVLSENRLRLGIGVGWNQPEYVALGEDFGRRGTRIEEQIDLLRRLWREDTVSFSGEFHEVPDLGINPRPVDDDVPIWIGGGADAVLRRGARLADGWIVPNEDFSAIEEKVNLMKEYLRRYDRDVEEFEIVGRMSLGPDGRLNGPESTSAEDRVSFAREWEQMGVTHLVVSTLGQGYEMATDHTAELSSFMDSIHDSDIDAGR